MVSNKLSLANLNNLLDISKFLSIKNGIDMRKAWHNNAKNVACLDDKRHYYNRIM